MLYLCVVLQLWYHDVKLSFPNEPLYEYPKGIMRLSGERKEILHTGDDISVDWGEIGENKRDDVSYATIDLILLVRSKSDVDRLFIFPIWYYNNSIDRLTERRTRIVTRPPAPAWLPDIGLSFPAHVQCDLPFSTTKIISQVMVQHACVPKCDIETVHAKLHSWPPATVRGFLQMPNSSGFSEQGATLSSPAKFVQLTKATLAPMQLTRDCDL